MSPLVVENLTKSFRQGDRSVLALDGISLEVRRGKFLAISGGEQQRVAIGRALANDPAVILADEPTGNLDSANSKSVCELLRDLSDKHGRTIVMVTHEPSVAAYAQEVAVLKDGRMIDRFATTGVGSSQELAARYQECLR